MKIRFGRLARTALIGGIAVLSLGAQGASAQGFFQSLFGGGQPVREGRSAYERDYNRPNFLFGNGAPDSVGTLDPDDPYLHREMNRRAKAKHRSEASGSTGKQTAIVATEDAPRGSLAYFEKDKTLRDGDVVVTDKGFMVYQGNGSRDDKSFVALNSVASTKTDRSKLLDLQRASRMTASNVVFEAVPAMRDFIGPRTAEQLKQQADLRGSLTTAAR